MFERYTEKARRTIFFGRYEASQFGSPYIESEHLLLGLFREDKSLTNTFLHSHASLESIRKQIEERTVIGEKVSTAVDLPLSNECKRILAYGAEEAERMSHEWIGTEHLFLGVLREKECLAAHLLTERGIVLETARQLIASKPLEPVAPSPESSGLPTGYTSHKLLYNPAAEALVLELRRSPTMRMFPGRLFFRHKDAEAYEQIGSPAEEVSYESPVTCEKHPLVVFNSFKWDKTRKGGDWDGAYLFNLSTKELALCISPEKLRFSEPHGRLAITNLVSLSEDARAVYLRVAIEKLVSGGAVVHYYLAKVDLADPEVKLLSRLLDISY